MNYQLQPMSEAEAREIATWRYPKPYRVYNPGPDAVASLLDERNNYYAVHDRDGVLVGFFCFGRDARVVSGLRPDELADSGALDVGLGMRPDLTGHGHGDDFLRAGLDFARERFRPTYFRLAVLTFNRRAIAAYLRAGFAPKRVFDVGGPRQVREFLLMTTPRSEGGESLS